MKRTLIVLLLGLMGTTGCENLRAQAEGKPVPKAPYLAPVPDYGHWTVSFKYDPPPTDGEPDKPKPPAVPEGFPTLIDTIKTGDLRGVVLTFADGTSRQFTCQGDWVLASTPKGPKLSIAGASLPPYLYYTPGFVLLDGVNVSPSTYKGTDMHNGVTAFHYKSGEVDVWIDIDSMLPLGVRQNGIEVTYQFLPPPPRPFVIPKDQADLLQRQLDAYKKVRSLR